MDVEELMIGDIVLFCGEHVKVTSLENSGYCSSRVFIKHQDGSIWPTDHCNLEPAPLTAEILKQNGIVKHKFAGHIEECYSRYVNPSDEQFILWEETNRFELVLRHIVDNLTYSALRCKVRYLHELQHALRICGVYMEIELPKED